MVSESVFVFESFQESTDMCQEAEKVFGSLNVLDDEKGMIGRARRLTELPRAKPWRLRRQYSLARIEAAVTHSLCLGILGE